MSTAIDSFKLAQAKQYLVVVNGETKPLGELTQEQLIIQLAGLIEHFEFLDSNVAMMTNQIAAWRRGQFTEEQSKFLHGEEKLS